jgi:hypothetical protein
VPRAITPLHLAHIAAPASPPSGYTALSARAGDLLYSEDSAGAERLVAAGPEPVRLTSAQNSTSTSLADVTGLGLAVEAGRRYMFRFVGQYTAAATTTGLGLAVNGPTLGSEGLLCNLFIGQTQQVPNLGTATAYNTALLATASSGSTRMPWECWGHIHIGGSAGTLQLRFRSEVNGSQVSIQAGSIGFAWAVG